jgi:hypothetical protein
MSREVTIVLVADWASFRFISASSFDRWVRPEFSVSFTIRSNRAVEAGPYVMEW